MRFEEAEAHMLAGWDARNEWFRDLYWPENAPRTRLLVKEVQRRFPNAAETSVIDIGCGFGHMSYIFRLMGYQVDGCDGTDYADREVLFPRAGIGFSKVNLNDSDPLSGVGTAYDVALLGEVFEHILNEPAALVRSIRSVLRTNGLLVLTTPNPSTAINAWRVLRDSYEPWGADEFMRMPKLDPTTGALTTYPGIHYREYPAKRIAKLLTEIGFTIDDTMFCGAGEAPAQRPVMRTIRKALRATGLSNNRLLGSSSVLLARAT